MATSLPDAPVTRDSELNLAELIEELSAQLDRGERIDLSGFLEAHPEHADELRRLFPALQLLADVSHSGTVHVPPSCVEADESASAKTLGDFRLVREIARGGMGVVYEAEQLSLGRLVALKVLPFAGALDPKQLQRFKNEAQAAAHLHHTNIVPVFYVGCERGVHFYAMQYIEGCTLAGLIRQLRLDAGLEKRDAKHPPDTKSIEILFGPKPLDQATPADLRTTTPELPSGPESGQNPSDDLSPRPRTRGRGAGGEGDSHTPSPPKRAREASQEDSPTPPVAALSTERSNKLPAFFRAVANLGIQAAEALEYAHQMGVVHRDIKPGNLLLDMRGNLWVTDFGLAQFQTGAELTMSGDLIGTLRYMSPEQALAQRVVIDQRTDIYSLGVTLYELLTLEPAFAGNDRQELLRQIAFDDPRPPHRLNKSIPRELEIIVQKAMEKNPVERYGTAKDLADDLHRYLLQEPIQARKASWVQQASKWLRRHPAVVRSAAILLLLVTAGSILSTWLVWREKKQTALALAAESAERDRAETEKQIAQAVGDFLRNKLLAQADPRSQAEAIRKSGGRTVGSKPNPTIRELLDRAASELASGKIEGQFPGKPLVQAEILRTIGEAYGGIGEYESAIGHLERARDLQIRELAPHHADTLATMNSLGRTYLAAGKPTEAARLLEQVRDLRIETLGQDHPDTLDSMNDLYRSYFALGRHDEALGLREDIVRLRRAKLGPDHRDTLQSMNNLANSYAAVGRFARALELHEEALTLRKATLDADHPDTLQSMNNVADCYLALDRKTEALKLHETVLELRRSKLGEDNPETLQSMNNVAFLYSALGRPADALSLYETTLALRTAKLHIEHPDTIKSMNTVAWELANSPDRKLRDPNRAVALARKAVELAPEKRDYWNTLGAAEYRVGDWKGAIAALTKSCALFKGGDGTDWFFLAMAHWRLGDKDQSRMWYEKALKWMEKNKPHDEELRRFRAEAAELLGIREQ